MRRVSLHTAVMTPLLGALGLALVHGLASGLAQPWPAGGLRVRLAHHLFDLAQLAALALGWALCQRDGLKVIIDLRHHTMEAYDLARDPKERLNLVDEDPARAGPALGQLQAFFDAHAPPAGAHRPVYKR